MQCDWSRPQPKHWFDRERTNPGRVWGNEELSLSFPAPWFLRLLSGGLARRLIRFSLLWEMDASSSRWLSQFQVYPYPQKQLSSADISFGSRCRARADKIAQTLVCSQIRQFHITFGRFISNYREKIAPFLDEKTFFQTEKYPRVVLKCWKCFDIISYNVEHRHTVLSASWPTLKRF